MAEYRARITSKTPSPQDDGLDFEVGFHAADSRMAWRRLETYFCGNSYVTDLAVWRNGRWRAAGKRQKP